MRRANAGLVLALFLCVCALGGLLVFIDTGEQPAQTPVPSHPPATPDQQAAATPTTSSGAITGSVHLDPPGALQTVRLEAVPLAPSAFPSMDGDRVGAQCRDNGAFRLDGLTLGVDYRLRATAQHYASVWSEPVRLTTEDPHVSVDLLLTLGSSISGLTIDDQGNRLANVELTLFPSFSDMLSGLSGGAFAEPYTFASDADGSFKIENVGEGQYVIRSGGRAVEAYLADGAPIAVLDLSTPVALETVRVVLPAVQKSRGIRGRVLSPDGVPAPNAMINITIDGESPVAVQATNASGDFTADVPPGEYELFASAQNGWAKTRTTAPADDVILSLEAYVSVSGVAVDEQGVEVPDASITMQAASPRQQGNRDNWLNPDMNGHTTDSLGRFKLRVGEAGSYVVHAVAEGGLSGQSDVFTVEMSSSTPLVRVVMDDGVSLSGRILDPAGNPIPAAEVSLSFTENAHNEMPALASIETQTQSDENGAYVFGHLPPGIYAVEAHAEGFANLVREDILVETESDVEGIDLVLTSGGAIQGVLLGFDDPERAGVHISSGSASASPSVDADGRFVAENLPAGSYIVILAPPGNGEPGSDTPMMKTVRVSDASVTDVVFDLRAAPALIGNVQFNSGRPASEIFVRLALPGAATGIPKQDRDPRVQQILQDTVAFSVVDPNSQFSLSGAEPGEYDLLFYEMNADHSSPAEDNPNPVIEPMHVQRVRITPGVTRLEIDIP